MIFSVGFGSVTKYQKKKKKKRGGGGVGGGFLNVLRRVSMHICLSVIRLFALKTFFRYIHKRLDAFLPWLHKIDHNITFWFWYV